MIDELALARGVRLADALIRAASLEVKATLISANLKHVGAMPGLDSDAFAP